ncbi:MAG: GNAT family N-acetyltransferase [Rhizomicrobium sp.]
MTISLNEHDLHALNRKLLAYLRAAAERRPLKRRAGPFLATFATDPNIYLNYAMPDDDADPSPDDVAALIALFEAYGRKPRLEYIPAAAPKVEAALLGAGFIAEARVPVMHCTPDMAVHAPATQDIAVFLATEMPDLIAVDEAQAEAYGAPPRGPGGHKRALRAGGLVAGARDMATGAVIGGGVAMPPHAGIGEIAGIGVHSGFRRRGAAGALTALLAREAFARGFDLLWLTPGGAEAERIYARAGFAAVSEALHISR